jgi:hypothetical protein
LTFPHPGLYWIYGNKDDDDDDDDDDEIKISWEKIRENINISVKDNTGSYKLK